MALFNWDDEFSVSVMTMDNHHKKIFDIINQMHEAMKSGAGEEAVAKIINELLTYTDFHFKEEEKLMEQCNFPGIAAQKSSHTAFIKKLTEFKESADQGRAIFVVSKVSKLGVDWLKDHILTMDKQYTESMNTAGIS
ncbi:MAG: bacteriohemerythrin [Gammaproteobacteria bacterium]|nr:bacteriohemerythrin [Gammaproteobacteria bacterium]